ncbi:helix-turn-helix domain-containing protein [Chryseobacterium flavum]|uniref:helix-turn-helix domain-containing protein n=1 Tax=Chryseobacterium flavum TaxID=415851 RepID=UPI0028AF3BC9|nr:helix-turn-helix domain-containing protein [Chryseobacterium flavum]
MAKSTPNYKLIFQDMLNKKFPEKKEICEPLLNKKSLSHIDIININEIIFGKPEFKKEVLNQQRRSYDVPSILQILKYQEKNNLSNSQLANHYKISRNTIAKWKKIFKNKRMD